MSLKLNIKDRAFGHQPCSIKGGTSDKITWCRDGSGDSRYQFYTNDDCFDVVNNGKINIAWITEPRSIMPQVYSMFPLIANKFHKVFTHDNELLTLSNAKWIHGGGSYIGLPVHGESEEKIYPKTKLCSIFSSNKTMCELHVARLQCALSLRGTKVDTFGGFDQVNPPWEPIVNSLKDYAYSIVFENQISDYFWTEKLNNCFLTGTVPIYIGARKINEYFDGQGILTFSSFQELEAIINNISFEDYEFRKEAIQHNFEEAKKYRMMEDYIYNYIIEELQ